jgi:hypothetical protein
MVMLQCGTTGYRVHKEDKESRGVLAWKQYVEDIQAWRGEYLRLGEKYAEAIRDSRVDSETAWDSGVLGKAT